MLYSERLIVSVMDKEFVAVTQLEIALHVYKR